MSIKKSVEKKVSLELKEIINNSWDGIGIIDNDTNFVYINDAFLPMFGFDKDELLHTDLISLLHVEYKDEFLSLLEKNSQNSYQTDINVVCKRKDLKPIYLKITVSLMLNKKYFVLNAKDITKEISDDKILDSYVLSLHINTKAEITYASKAFCNLSEYTLEELTTQKITNFAKQTQDSSLEELLKTIKNDKEWNNKVEFQKNKGISYWVDLRAKPIYNKYGDITGATLLMFDITNEFNLNAEIQQKDKILIDQSKLAVMNDTIKILAHEWRQPLNLISINAQKLELDFMDNEHIDSEVTKTLQSIKHQTDKLSKVIEDFQSFTNTNKSKIKIKANDIITHAISIFNLNNGKNNINVEYEVLNNSSFETYTNELTNVFVNILINAKEAIIKKNIDVGRIKIKELIKDNKILFEISDNAKGIKEDIIDKIFDPYYSTKDSQQGVGLGLYTCKVFIQMHLGGTIFVKNGKDGAVFTIELPLN